MNIIERIEAPTPGFFKKLRNIGIVLVAISTVILSAPVSLPAIVTSIAGYAAVAGAIIGSVSQLTTEKDAAVLSKTDGLINKKGGENGN